ncbi:FecR domain-containing protein [Achromobacter pestifer]|nr:FecR domain-containing protein [Achromobacter pestifer]
MSQERIDPGLVQEAATWMMRLSDEGASESDWEAWRQWTSQSPQHEQLRQLAQTLTERLQRVPPSMGWTALNAPRAARRRAALKAASVLLVAGPATWLALRLPWHEWNADYETGTGSRRVVELADGSRITLDTASSVNISFTESRRLVELVSGRIFVATAVDPAARPFMVSTRQGLVRAIGTRFDVRQNALDSQVAVTQGAVEITAADAGASPVTLQAGQQARFTRTTVEPPTAANELEFLWVQGRIQVENVALGDLIRELARYRPGVLRCDPLVATLRVSGRYDLDDTDLALRLLASSLPIRISRLSSYWVTVGPKSD